MAAPLLHTRLPGDAAASSSAVKMLGASRTGISNMRALENDFFNSPPRKTVRFGGTVTEVLLKYKKRLPWLNRSQTVVEEYLAFLGNLVSAQTVFLRPCLSMIASHFVPPRVIIKEGDVDVSDSDDEDDNLPANFDTCHRALQIIARYVPSTPWFLMPILVEKFPFVRKSERTLVNASRQGIEDAEETATQTCGGTDSTEGLFNMDEDEETEHETKAGPERLDQMVHPVAERLDILMSLVLSYMKDVCFVDGKVDNGKTKDLYRDLINIFDKLLLPTHASCHVQFFMFYLCSFKLTVKSCLDLLVNWLHIYLNNQDSGTKAFCDVALHGPFYSACQAVFYTFVFRHKQLLSGNLKEGLQYLQSLNFERIVMSQLNPLKICLPSVVNFFAAITNKYQLVFCYTIIERNNRQMLPVIRSTAGGDSVQTCTNPLDTFFPFDPCVLKRSKKFIDPIYQVWEDMSAEELQEFKKPMKKDIVEDEDDDFLKGEVPQNDTVLGITPSSFDTHFRSPSSSVGSPPVLYMQPSPL
uniref:RRN3 homolog, RNA polymerase I transcription factor n=1 Tax=Gorilla gorilla gorilla TaxID=9595 RepID=G3S684_GORGO